jgi:hypothetical protein
LDIISVSALKGLSDIGGRLLEIYRIRRDGSFFEQQNFLADLKKAEEERAGDREIDKDLRQAEISVSVKNKLDRQERLLANSPFSYTPEEVRRIAIDATDKGRVPALLIAPYHNDNLSLKDNSDAPHAFRVAVRRSWLATPWSADLAPLDGIVNRPLSNTDLDVLLIQQTLHDLPIVLVYGEVQGNLRVWTSIVAWNLVETPQVPSIHVSIPPIPLPSNTSDTTQPDQHRLAFEDDLGARVATTIGVLGEWFHLVKYGRTPRIHRLLPREMDHERKAIAGSLAAAYDLTIERNTMHNFPAQAEKAVIYAEAGLDSRAIETGRDALEHLRRAEDTSARERLYCLRRLALAFDTAGETTYYAEVRSLVEATAREVVLDDLGWNS